MFKYCVLMICALFLYCSASLRLTPNDSAAVREFLDANGMPDVAIDFPNLVQTTGGRVTKLSPNTNWPNLLPKRITTLPAGLKKLDQLKSIVIEGFEFDTIPPIVKELPLLEQFGLRDGPLKKVNSVLFDVKKLKQISFYNCPELSIISDDIKNATALEKIFIDSCNIAILPETMGELAKLYLLKLTNLPLKQLPKDLHTIEGFTDLEIKKCTELQLTENIGKLNLKTLILDSCNISELPECEYNTSRLGNLYLQQNKLKKLPKSFENIRTLWNVGLRNNEFETVPFFWAENPELHTFSAHYNKLNTFPDFLCSFGKIQKKVFISLILSNNQIDSIPEITDSLYLQILDLSHNKLETLPKSIMKIVPDPNMFRFIFDYNYLHDLDPEIEAWLDYVTKEFGWRDTQLSVGIESPEVKEVMKPNVVQYDKKSKKLNLILKESSPVSIQLIDAKGRVIQNVFEGKKQRGSSSVDLSGIRAVGSNFYILSCTINGKRFNVPMSHIQ